MTGIMLLWEVMHFRIRGILINFAFTKKKDQKKRTKELENEKT